MTPFLLSQILVGIAIATDLISFQFKQRRHIVACLFTSCLLISVHFMLLDHWTAAWLGLLAASRFLTSLFSTSRLLMFFFLLATLLVAFFTYSGILTLLGAAGGLFGTMASFCREDKTLRQLMLVGTCLWLCHNILAGSPLAVLMEALFISSNLVGYFRFYILPKRRKLAA